METVTTRPEPPIGTDGEDIEDTDDATSRDLPLDNLPQAAQDVWNQIQGVYVYTDPAFSPEQATYVKSIVESGVPPEAIRAFAGGDAKKYYESANFLGELKRFYDQAGWTGDSGRAYKELMRALAQEVPNDPQSKQANQAYIEQQVRKALSHPNLSVEGGVLKVKKASNFQFSFKGSSDTPTGGIKLPEPVAGFDYSATFEPEE